MSPDALAERAWPEVDRLGTLDALNGFVARYPNSPRAAESSARILSLSKHAEYQAAASAGTRTALEEFLTSHPAADDATMAYESLRMLFVRSHADRIEREWQSARASNDVATLAAFAQRNATSPLVLGAREQLQRLAPDSGFAEHMRALAQLERDELPKKAPSERVPVDFTLGFYPALSRGLPLSIIYKDRDQHYVRMSIGVVQEVRLETADEYLQLRGIAPYAAFILLIDETDADMPEKLWSDFTHLYLRFTRTHCLALLKKERDCGNPTGRFAPLGFQEYPRKMSGTQIAQMYVQIARRNPAYGTRLQNIPAPAFEDSPFVVARVERLGSLVRTRQGRERGAAVVGLLQIPGALSAATLTQLASTHAAELVQALLHPTKAIQVRAEEQLVRAGPLAVPELLNVLGPPSLRPMAIPILGKIRDARAIGPLVGLLTNPDAGPLAVMALRSMDWQPATDVERVGHLIATRNRTELRTQFPMVSSILFHRIATSKGIDFESVNVLVAIGHQDAVPGLRSLLANRGTDDLALLFLRCGNKELSEAAVTWANARGYRVLSIPMPAGKSAGASWGRF